VTTECAGLHVSGLPMDPSTPTAKSDLGRRHKVCWVAGSLSPCMPGLDAYRNIDFRPGRINNSGTTSLNTPSYPVPFPSGLHALPLRYSIEPARKHSRRIHLRGG